MAKRIESGQALRIRPATFADAEAINQVHHRNGMDRFDTAAWRFCWESYPFAPEFAHVPIGWVLETGDGKVVGTIANIHMLYEMDGQRVKAAIAASWAVDATHRSEALRLNAMFFKQAGIDLWLNGSASPTTSQILTALRVPRIPVPNYNTPCFWAANHTGFARAVLRRRGISSGVPAVPVALVLLAWDIIRRSGRGSFSNIVRPLKTFDDRFDSLWQAIRNGPSRLRAVRTRAVLEWRFQHALDAGRIRILTAESVEDLIGYIVLMRRRGSDLGMDIYDVADMQAAGDDQNVFKDLLLGAVQLAREEGVDAIKFLSGTPAKRAPAEALCPYTYQLPFWQLYYKASPPLSAALGSAEAWDFSLFDTY